MGGHKQFRGREIANRGGIPSASRDLAEAFDGLQGSGDDERKSP